MSLTEKRVPRGSARNFPTGVDSSDGRLKYSFKGTINARNPRKDSISPSDGGIA